MSKLPTVAIIGRPNTGKSTLFNRLVGERRAIESPIAGTTRDHISARISFGGITSLLIDTGGIGSSRDKDFESDVAEQSFLALGFADVILFTVNGKEEVTADDRRIIDILRKKKRQHVPVITVITKADDRATADALVHDYQDMGIGTTTIAISAPHRIGIDALVNAVAQELKSMRFTQNTSEDIAPEDNDTSGSDDDADAEIQKKVTAPPARIAIIGKPNVGKSSIVNALMSDVQKERSPQLVSPIAGTTRDAVDTEVTYHGKRFVLVDTAGLKKHARTLDDIERFAMIRTITAVENSDVVILVLDASEPIAQQDKRIASIAVESGKGLIILLNKIDTMKGEKRKEVVEYTKNFLHFCSKFATIIPCSAVTREGIVKLFDIVDAVQKSRTMHISTRELRRWFETHIHGRPLGEAAKIKHLTQTKDIPPTFALFCNHPKRVNVTQLRNMENRLRETFGFDGTPIRWVLKGGEEKAKKGRGGRKVR